METVILILLLIGGGFLLYYVYQVQTRRTFVAEIVAQREKHPFHTDDAFKAHIREKVPSALNDWVRDLIADALFDFFAKFSLTGAGFPSVTELFAQYPNLDPKSVDKRVNTYLGWGIFELEANLWSKPELWQLVDSIIDDVVKATIKIIPSEDEVLVLPSSVSNSLQPLLHNYQGPQALYKFLRIDAEGSRNSRLLLGPDQAFNELTERISAECAAVAVPDDLWFQHAFLFAKTGSGKTNALSYLISRRLDQVVRGEASVVVMDSGTDLLRGLSRLKRFAPGGDLDGKLVHIDFSDVEYSVGINPFEMPDDNLSLNELDALHSTTIRMLNFLYESILDMPLSGRQGMMMAIMTELLLTRKGSALGDLLTLVRHNGTAGFQNDIARMDKEAQDYFASFDNPRDPLVKQTKSHVETKLFGLRSLPALRNLLRAPKTTLKLDEEFQSPKVILINLAASQLDPTAVEGIGRFFLSRILRATHRRLLLEKRDRLKTYIFIDECQTTIGEQRDTSIDALFDQARKSNVSLMLASTRPDLLHQKVQKAIFGNAAIRMAARVTPDNAKALSQLMATEPEVLLNPPNYTFPTFVDGLTPTASLFAPPETDFNEMPAMSEPEQAALKERMRDKYYYRVERQTRREPTESDLEHDPAKAAPW